MIEIDVFKKLLYRIHDSTSHGVHNIIIYNIVSHNSLFLFCFLDITHSVRIYEFQYITHVHFYKIM